MANELEEQKKETPILSQKTYENGWTPDYNESTPKVSARNAKWEEAADQRSREWEEKHAQDKAKTREEYAKKGIDYPTYAPPGSKESELMQKIGGINMLGRAAEQGQKAQDVIENVDIPRYKGITFKDLMNDPRFEGKRDALLSNAIATAGANALLGSANRGSEYTSRLGEYNNAQMANYANMQAEKDQRALNANLDAIDAANAQKIAMEASLADTMANTYIERYKSTEDAKTKQEVLKQMLEDSDKLFNDPNMTDEKIINLATYMGLLSGDYSLTARLIQKYAPKLLGKLDNILNWAEGKGKGGDNPPVEGGEPTPNLVYGTPKTPVTKEVYESNPDDYIKIPLKDGTTAVVRKYHSTTLNGQKTTKDEENDFWDTLLNNVDYENDDELYEYVKAWAPLAPAKTNILQKKLEEKHQGEAEKQKAFDDAKTSLDNLVKSFDNGSKDAKQVASEMEKLKDKLDMNNQDVVSTYNSLATKVNGGIALDKFKVARESTSWSNKQKADEIKSILNDYSDYISPQDQRLMQQKVDDYTFLADVQEPFMETLTGNLFSSSKVKSGNGFGGWKVMPNGNIQYIDTGSIMQNENVASYPGTYTIDGNNVGRVERLYDSLASQFTPSNISTLIKGSTIDEKNDNLKRCSIYKTIKGLVNNSSAQKRAKLDTSFKKKYDALLEIYNDINNNVFFTKKR